ncbi:spore germination protein GerPB [Neobacillus sp. D3-1R]|uniref:spore germination protein GerPB n=1 Tax=Neobacillus sp. D3-1R TaxID=3445778 RepID=UPI003FA03CC2
MNFYIQQSIQINTIKIGSVTNSSVLQIGSAGVIRPTSHLFNTGGFIKPAPEAKKPTTKVTETPPTTAPTVSDTVKAPAVPISVQ